MFVISDDLVGELLEFRDVRNWKQFHTPRNLAASLVIEASELLECFQWIRDDELSRVVVQERGAIEDELADVAILLTYLCVDLGIDVETIVKRKLISNGEKYPVDRSWGTSRKYDKL